MDGHPLDFDPKGMRDGKNSEIIGFHHWIITIYFENDRVSSLGFREGLLLLQIRTGIQFLRLEPTGLCSVFQSSVKKGMRDHRKTFCIYWFVTHPIRVRECCCKR